MIITLSCSVNVFLGGIVPVQSCSAVLSMLAVYRLCGTAYRRLLSPDHADAEAPRGTRLTSVSSRAQTGLL